MVPLRRHPKLFGLSDGARGARARVAGRGIGRLRVVQVEYPQGWLADRVGLQRSKQASGRTESAEAGAGGALGDIGTHAFQLACFVTGQVPDTVLADLSAIADGRALDDNAAVLLRFASGARGILWASQVAIGCMNGLRLRVFGEAGSLDWFQEQPNELWVDRLGAPRLRIVPGGPSVGSDAARMTRLPAGHPEGFQEAFAAIYRDAAELIRARRCGGSVTGAMPPGMQDGCCRWPLWMHAYDQAAPTVYGLSYGIDRPVFVFSADDRC